MSQQLDPTREFSVIQFRLLAQSAPDKAGDAYHRLLDRYQRLCLNIERSIWSIASLEQELNLVKSDRLDLDREVYELKTENELLKKQNELLRRRLQRRS